jgi:hypothetical protein
LSPGLVTVPNVLKGFGSILASFFDEDFVTAWVLRGKRKKEEWGGISLMIPMLYVNYKIRRRSGETKWIGEVDRRVRAKCSRDESEMECSC